MNWLNCSPVAFLCAVSLVWQKASSIDMELRVKRGDNIILYCDRAMKTGSDIVWFRGFSANAQTCSNISVLQEYTNKVFNRSTSHLTPVWNAVNKSYDLVIKNITESDRGLYYCASEDKRSFSGAATRKKVFNISKDVTWVSVRGNYVSADVVPTTSSPLTWKCGQCWVEMVSLCLVCVVVSALTSSACVYCLCSKTNKGQTESVASRRRTDIQPNRSRRQNEDGDLFYASLRLPTVRHMPRQNKRTQNTEFTTYSEVTYHR